jgi:hypothetical protein
MWNSRCDLLQTDFVPFLEILDQLFDEIVPLSRIYLWKVFLAGHTVASCIPEKK